jgi:hypothetical protein
VAGEKLAPEAFDKMLDQISEVKHELAAKLQQPAKKKPQPEKSSGEGSGDLAFFADPRVRFLRFSERSFMRRRRSPSVG